MIVDVDIVKHIITTSIYFVRLYILVKQSLICT